MQIPKPGEKYKHFKDKEYEIVTIANDCENSEHKFVVYKQLYETENYPMGSIWVRDLENFMSNKKLPTGEVVKRFSKIE